MSIRQLPREVVDRIAAGEVVERPAAVVKELVENALDAGASRIDVTIEGGGQKLLRVADDGHGIGLDDLPLAFAAHATSKLHDVDDLFHIASFGFRGEALASIGAVSRARLVSATDDSGQGAVVTCVAGEASAPSPVASRRGTVVEVRDLFFNTPARRSFLGASSTESARCREVCSALSLVHPGVRWRVEVDGRERFVGEGAEDDRARVAAVYGQDFAESLTPVEAAEEGLSVRGWLTRPAAARSRARAQQLFVNGRLVKDRRVLAAVRVACKDFLPGSLQPSWILELLIDPNRVDVNVHPTKAEVRFRDGDRLFRLVRHACRQALLATDLAPRVRAEHVDPHGATPVAPARPPAADAPTLPTHEPSGRPHTADGLPWSGGPRTDVPGTAAQPGPDPVRSRAAERVAEPGPRVAGLAPAARFLQVLDTYIVHDTPDGLVILDQHALHERILYARLQADLAAGRLASQRLLVPETLTLLPGEYERALELTDDLARMGLEIAPFGPDILAVSAVPAVLRGESLEDLLRALIDPPDVHGGIPNGLDRRLFTMACHAAVKAGDPLDEAEIRSLIEQGQELEHDSTCPHGRPTRLVIGRTELERLFKRSGF